MAPDFTKCIVGALAAAGLSTTDPLLVGFSGGRDSVALTAALLLAGFSNVTLIHLDHALRPESAAEAEWVASFAQTRNLDVVIDRVAVAELAAQMGAGIEETARHARHAFFATVARERACSSVLLAHHANDQIETLVFRLLRGAGPGGLSAMAPKSERHEERRSYSLLRPMLGIWRAEIDAFVKKQGLPFLEDPSNALPDFTRNRIRHSLLAEMERCMRRPVHEALWRTAEVLRAEADFVKTAELLLGPVPEQLDVFELRQLPLALLRRRVARWLSERGVSDIGFDLVESVSHLALRIAPAKVNLPKGAHARRKAGRIFFEGPPLLLCLILLSLRLLF
ncbi:MAG: tRNA(Ile)-lysidine synthase [Verrucomicrobia bacterium]|nr:MAG: tRNA(Ile)-lysidine synthase [Verrucomicrobiota bacterium]